MKKIKRFLGACLIVSTVFCAGFSTSAHSEPTDIGLKEGDILSFDDGDYTVYFGIDGKAYLAKDGIMPLSTNCINGREHQYRVQEGKSIVQEKISNDSTYCYKEKVYIRNVCDFCHNVEPSLESEKKEEHKYKLFEKQCKNKVNGTRCSYTK